MELLLRKKEEANWLENNLNKVKMDELLKIFFKSKTGAQISLILSQVSGGLVWIILCLSYLADRNFAEPNIPIHLSALIISSLGWIAFFKNRYTLAILMSLLPYISIFIILNSFSFRIPVE